MKAVFLIDLCQYCWYQYYLETFKIFETKKKLKVEKIVNRILNLLKYHQMEKDNRSLSVVHL